MATAPTFDVTALRADFPILETTVHGRPLVYLDNAATTQKPRAVLQAIQDYYATSNANVHRACTTERARHRPVRGRPRPRRPVHRRRRSARDRLHAERHRGHQPRRPGVGPRPRRRRRRGAHHRHGAPLNIVPWQMLCAEKGATLRVVPMFDSGDSTSRRSIASSARGRGWSRCRRCRTRSAPSTRWPR